jgi:S-DNA-T family DNA segregation ATPase FtsK/SpoIIIE
MAKDESTIKMNVLESLAFLLQQAWKLNKKLHGVDSDTELESIIRTIWERANIYVKVGEGENERKYYPELVDIGWSGANKVLYYRLPAGMKYSQITKNLDVLTSYLKSEILPRFLENHPKAHFSLTVLSGHLFDYIEADIEKLTKELDVKGKGLWVPIGYSRRGLEAVNLADHNTAHMLIGGSIGGGKSTLLRLILTFLHLRYTIDDINIWTCDFKHGNEMKILGKNPLLVTRTIQKPEQAENFFTELYLESERRYMLFEKMGDVTNLNDYNKKAKTKIPHIILAIDELGKLEGKEYKDARLLLKHITGDGRAAGIHVIMAMHRPTANIVDGTLKNNLPVVVGFRCNPISARVLFGEDQWELSQEIDHEIPGRAIFLYSDPVLVQVPWLSEEETQKIMASYQFKSACVEDSSIVQLA